MAETRIGWTATRLPDGTLVPGYTFNPWRGCTKVSEGCKHCYAETGSLRNRAVLGEWGPKGARAIAAESYWRLPFKWNRKAREMGVQLKVFTASLGDIFEEPSTMREEDVPRVKRARERLWTVIEATPHLNWLILTKRPHAILSVLAEETTWLMEGSKIPDHVWFGTSVENQKTADERIIHLLTVPCKIRFLSCEPLLGPLDLSEYLFAQQDVCEACGEDFGLSGETENGFNAECRHCGGTAYETEYTYPLNQIHWVLCGGENAKDSRPMHPQWARDLLLQCRDASVPFFLKQWGSDLPYEGAGDYSWKGQDGTHYDQWEWDQQPREGLTYYHTKLCFRHMDKKGAGNLLDGELIEEFPEVEA